MNLIKGSLRTLLITSILALLGACAGSTPTASVTLRYDDMRPLLIQNVAVFDSESLTVWPNMDVRIESGKVSAVDPTGNSPIGNDVQLISGEGATLVPGLIDMHGHITTTTGPSWDFSMPDPDAAMLAYLYAGVTTIFDPSDSSDEEFERRDHVASGTKLGPRIFTTGRIITAPEGHPRALVRELAPWWISWYLLDKVATGVANNAEAIAAVNDRVDAGADAIKIVVDSIPLHANQLDPPLVKSIIQHAKSRGVRSVAHIGTTQDAIVAAEAGVALWVHGVYKERIPDQMISKLVAYDIPVVTTSEVFDRYGRALLGPIDSTKLEKEIVAKSVLDSFWPAPDDFELGEFQAWQTLMSETIDVRLDNVARLHAGGAIILAGSDVQSGVFPGASLHRELATLVKAGMTPAQAIRAATLDSARFLADGQEPDSGIIAVGKRADLLLVEGDPSADIGALQNIREVFLQGIPIDRVAVAN